MNRQSKKRILIADSDKARLTALTVILESDDFEVFPVSDADGCLMEARAKKPVLLILNTNLGSPEATQSVLSGMKSDPSLEGIPVLLLSEAADASEDDSDGVKHLRQIRHPHDLIRQIDAILRRTHGNAFTRGR